MKLTDLNPRWVGAGGAGVTRKGEPVPERFKVGLSFDCPCEGVCNQRVFLYFENSIDGGESVGIPNWYRNGDMFETMTLTPSIRRLKACGWHGYLTDGEFKSV